MSKKLNKSGTNNPGSGFSNTENVTIRFADGSSDTVPYDPEENLLNLLFQCCETRGISVENIKLLDFNSQKKIKWDKKTTVGGLNTKILSVEVAKDKGGLFKKKPKSTPITTTAAPSKVTPTTSTSSSPELKVKKSSEESSEKSKSWERTDKKPRGISVSPKSLEGGAEPKSEEISGPLSSVGGSYITIYFGTGEFKRVPADAKKTIIRVLLPICVQRGIFLKDINLVDNDSGKVLQWNDDTLFGEFQTNSFRLVEKTEEEKKLVVASSSEKKPVPTIGRNRQATNARRAEAAKELESEISIGIPKIENTGTIDTKKKR